MTEERVSRRAVLRGLGVGGTVGLAGCTVDWDDPLSSRSSAPANVPVDGDSVVFGFVVPQDTDYNSEGLDQLRGYDLAVRHLNEGGGWVDQWPDLSGDGLLGRRVEYVDADSGTARDVARESVTRLIEEDGAVMVSGCSSTVAALAAQRVCERNRVVFMSCLTHRTAPTSTACSRYGFREMFNTAVTGRALAPVLESEFGSDVEFFQLYADYAWGNEQQVAMRRALEGIGWSQLEARGVPVQYEETTYEDNLRAIPRDRPDVLVLGFYGRDADDMLPVISELGLKDDMEVVIPLYNRLLSVTANEHIEGIYGTVDWNWQLEDPASKTFTEAFGAAYESEGPDPRVPSYAARLAYTQTLQYAAAVERAGTFNPEAVIQELEDHEYEGAGLGRETMRGCDHQAVRDVVVARGLPPERQTGQRKLEVIDQIPRGQLWYGCDGPGSPAASCVFGDE